MAWDVLSGVTKTAWDVLSGVANQCGMFCPGWQKMAWDVLSRDVLSYILTPVSSGSSLCDKKSMNTQEHVRLANIQALQLELRNIQKCSY